MEDKIKIEFDKAFKNYSSDDELNLIKGKRTSTVNKSKKFYRNCRD